MGRLSVHSGQDWQEGGEAEITCRGKCDQYKVCRVNTRGFRGYYLAGNKRCSVCCLYIRWEGNRCPCCNYPLRLNTRSSRAKRAQKRMRERIDVRVEGEEQTGKGIQLKVVTGPHAPGELTMLNS